MSKEVKILPAFRFPEFKNEGEWQQNVVSQVADYENGKAHEQDIDEEGKYIVVNSKFISTEGEVRKYSNSANCIAKKNDVLMVLSDVPNGRAIAKCFYVDKDDLYTVNQRICKLTPTNADSRILYYLLDRNSYFLSFDDGVKQTNLRNEDVLNCPIVLPENPQEQQKIASCLSSLDELLAAHNEKLDALKDHKKGLMQNLFPQEDETVPKVRFSEFEDDGDWLPTTVEDNCLVKGRIGYRGYTKQDLVKEGEGVLVLGGKHIQNQLLNISDPTFLSWEKYYESPEIMVEVNHIIFSQRGSLGDCAIIDREIGEATINPSMVLMRDINCNPRFLYYVLIGDEIQKEVSRNSTTAAIPMLSQKQIKEFPFLIPKPVEQQKIATCLSAVDELIIAQTEKIEQLHQHKKGLMQGLFPKMDS